MDEVQASQAQDVLRPIRQFIAGLSAVYYGDQSYADSDAQVWNQPGQFTVIGPRSSAVEGQPITITRAGGVSISPQLVLIALGAAAVWFFKK